MTPTNAALLLKYDQPIPRYTSYPTVPFWQPESLSVEQWKQQVTDRFTAEANGLSVYMHLPFCENLCTFCACNKRITVNHAVEHPYLQALLKEWGMYMDLFTGKPVLHELHLGGGTPTFFSPENLTELISSFIAHSVVPENHRFSVEVHPNFTRREHLEALAAVGFNRVSLGVQDFDPVVQEAINRRQSFEVTKEVVEWSRALGYGSINIDLIYGLPHQTVTSVEYTIARILELMPDRIAFYSYAHVPWKSKVQRRYTESDLPDAKNKWNMYQRGRTLLMQAGNIAIGMDHFALPEDELKVAAAKGKLHRNFMGYTTTNNKLLIGLGASSISDSWDAFFQNEKDIDLYQQKIAAREFPKMNGHLLSPMDQQIRKTILSLMCTGAAEIPSTVPEDFLEYIIYRLNELASDQLIERNELQVKVTALGETFIRNIAAALDMDLWKQRLKGNGERVFSKAI